jgi:CDP-diacylglycerol--serine O-phosphatidyltransferase
LTAGTLAFLGSLPFGWLSYRGYQRRSREAKAEAAAAPAARPAPAASALIRSSGNDERPSRLN